MKNRYTRIISLRSVGFFVFVEGIILNVKMFIMEEWPTYVFFILTLFGAILLGLSYLKKSKL